MKNIFDYAYYRIAKSYFKKDGSDAITAILTIALIKFLYLLNIYFFCKDLFFFTNEARMVGIIEKGIIILLIYLVYLQTKKNIRINISFLEKNGSTKKKTRKE